MKLFDGYVEPPKPVNIKIPRPKGKRKGKITITYSQNGKYPFGVDFEGFQEGSGSPCATEEEVQECVEKLKKSHGETYDLKVIDERPNNIKYSYLNEWKKFIEDFCKEKLEEAKAEAKNRSDSVWVDFNSLNYEPEIWFDTSAPYECCIGVRIKGHKCYYECISLRFQNGLLKAWDNGFQSPMGSGTNMIFQQHQTHIDRQNKIRELMERVLNNECCINCKEETEKRNHKTDEFGWRLGLMECSENGVKKDE